MPVTFHPSAQPLASIGNGGGYRARYGQRAKDPRNLLSLTCNRDLSNKCGEIFQSSFAADASQASASDRFSCTDLSTQAIYSATNGFVNAAVSAYSSHHALVIKPDDVWIAILVQFNLYVNANAEKLREVFVNHEGQKSLTVKAVGTRYTVDFGSMAQQMGHLIQEYVKDPTLREWIIPDFTTTTANDQIVASVIMMATLKKYFSYKFRLCCGLPAVTLLGEKSDWQKLLTRIEKLPSFDTQTQEWYGLLRPVLTRFVNSFDQPESEANKDFWQKIAHYSGGGSGPTYLSGWITAFCYFDAKGKPLYSEKAFKSVKGYRGKQLGELELDGVPYHRVDTLDLPPGYAEVDVKLDDNGKMFETIMVAGLVGIHVSSSGKETEEHSGKDDTMQPVAGWWLFETTKNAQEDESTIQYGI